MSIILLCGVVIQAFKGYYNFEISQYIIALYGFQLIDLFLLCVLAMFIQTIVNHKFIGYFVVIVYYLFDIFFMESIGLEHNLYDFASDPGSRYSDMNGYGHYTWPYFLYKTILECVCCHTGFALQHALGTWNRTSLQTTLEITQIKVEIAYHYYLPRISGFCTVWWLYFLQYQCLK